MYGMLRIGATKLYSLQNWMDRDLGRRLEALSWVLMELRVDAGRVTKLLFSGTGGFRLCPIGKYMYTHPIGL